MNEEQKENTPKAKLPLKTKIAVFLIYGLVVCEIILILVAVFNWHVGVGGSDLIGPFFAGVIIVSIISIFCILYFLSGVFLQIGKGWGWWFAIIIQLITIVAIPMYTPSPYQLLPWLVDIGFLIPLILILLDRKNYFEFVHQRNLAKENIEKDNA
jgi:hypothetical protein